MNIPMGAGNTHGETIDGIVTQFLLKAIYAMMAFDTGARMNGIVNILLETTGTPNIMFSLIL